MQTQELLMAIVIAVALLAIAIGAPRAGLLALWRRARQQARRRLVEDALKHLHDHEQRGVPATLESLSGALDLRILQAVELVTRLQRDGLVQPVGATWRLTPEGEGYALQVIRAHRLWERYLADEAGLRLRDLHGLAERKEHRLSATESEALEAQLGYPTVDPHGDQIPQKGKGLERHRATRLVDWPVGRRGRIVHVEDEVPAVLDHIVSERLLPGTEVEVLEADARGLHIRAGDRECWLGPVEAASVTVEATHERPWKGKVEPLTALKPGDEGTVVRLMCQGLTRRRLLDLG